jgi:hypothetical protein
MLLPEHQRPLCCRNWGARPRTLKIASQRSRPLISKTVSTSPLGGPNQLIRRAITRLGFQTSPKQRGRPVLSQPDHHNVCVWSETITRLVRSRRLELPRVAPQRPQRCASTNSATTANSYRRRQSCRRGLCSKRAVGKQEAACAAACLNAGGGRRRASEGRSGRLAVVIPPMVPNRRELEYSGIGCRTPRR